MKRNCSVVRMPRLIIVCMFILCMLDHGTKPEQDSLYNGIHVFTYAYSIENPGDGQNHH